MEGRRGQFFLEILPCLLPPPGMGGWSGLDFFLARHNRVESESLYSFRAQVLGTSTMLLFPRYVKTLNWIYIDDR
jgi:hypothetical protein